MRFTITPAGEEKRKLFISTRLECWHYNGEPESTDVLHEGEVVPVWLFRFYNIEEEAARQHIIRSYMLRHRMTEPQALHWLETHLMGIPQSQITVRLTESEEA